MSTLLWAHLRLSGSSLLESLLTLLDATPRFTKHLTSSPSLVGAITALTLHPDGHVKVTVLKIIQALYARSPNPKLMIARHSMYDVIAKLALDEKHIVVQQLAIRMMGEFQFNDVI
ncbi:hypothetical protein KIPB_004719 [Kipferlia bialata]|uniref:Clathrin/coatomer adaptor adaptin-like N-terminal domain-containing protein n=1 Tax=Kipferlia bialata TaxID=797122 RepID=A0A9K3CXE4_9EUKA|nr:hypothetical protein KIPB_004719 [Kipferlia bialata]|eukprot:g4719.t1